MHVGNVMSIAVDQTRLRRIVRELLPGASLERAEAVTILQFVQLAAGADDHDDPIEHSIMLAIAQHISSIASLEPEDILPIPRLSEEGARMHWFRALAAQLGTRGARELAYVLSFLVSVADLVLTDAEREDLEEFQRALELDDRRATDLIVFATEAVATNAA